MKKIILSLAAAALLVTSCGTNGTLGQLVPLCWAM